MGREPIRTGIAGLGRSGWAIHANLLTPMGDLFRIAAVADDDPARRSEAMSKFGCRAYATYPEMLADPDIELIVVSLPSHLHTSASLAALAAGKHVVCEKPMAISLPDADRMVEATAAGGRILTVFQQRRYNPDFVKVREIVESGLLGRIVQIRMTESRFSRRWDWQTLQKFGGGSLNNTGAHYLDMALQLFGPSEPTVFAKLERTLTLGDADDHLKVILSGDGAPTIDLEISSADPYSADNWHILGTQGGLAGSTKALRWRWIVPEELEPRTLDLRPTPDRSYNRDALPWHEDSWTLSGDTDDAYRGFYRDLYATIREGAPLQITPESVRRVIWVQEECHRLSPLPQEFN
jgi:scyllo-inositol 2-dehydrogenase (NADP+)